MPSHLVPRPLLHATSIFFLVKSLLISRSTVLTTTNVPGVYALGNINYPFPFSF
jgi:hypothetical protein